MLWQRRGENWRLFGQHDHAMFSGALAQAWAGGERSHPLHTAFLLAVSLHDMPWQAHDARSVWRSGATRPWSFLEVPMPERLLLYQSGLDQLEAIHPYVGLLVSLHYAAFRGLRGEEVFQQKERDRQQRLRDQVKDLGWSTASETRHLKLLQQLDLLSLYVCLCAPGADREAAPPWLREEYFAFDAKGDTFSLSWEGEQRLVLSPSPLCAPLSFVLPFATVTPTMLSTPESWGASWSSMRWTPWHLEVVGSDEP